MTQQKSWTEILCEGPKDALRAMVSRTSYHLAETASLCSCHDPEITMVGKRRLPVKPSRTQGSVQRDPAARVDLGVPGHAVDVVPR